MKSVLVIGLGKFGRHMARTFIREHNSVLAIEHDEARADNAIDIVHDIQIGDATNESFMKSIGVSNFDICVIGIGDDFQKTLELIVLLKDLGANFILARASKESHRKLLLRNGADHVVYAEREVAERLAIKHGRKNVFEYINLTDQVGIYEIAVPESWYGKSIIELKVRTVYKVGILATVINGEISPLPPSSHVFTRGENLMIMGDHENVKELVSGK